MQIHSPHVSCQSGFSLLEVLIAMLVLASGAGGLALLLLTSVQGTAQAQDHSRALLQASELAQLIHSNPATLGHFMYPTEGSANCAEGQPCPSVEWANSHLEQWQRALRENLSDAQGLVCRDSSPMDGDPADAACDGNGVALVKVVWQQPARNRQATETRRVVLPLNP
jgi:type IV pilus assembly protein PilV